MRQKRVADTAGHLLAEVGITLLHSLRSAAARRSDHSVEGIMAAFSGSDSALLGGRIKAPTRQSEQYLSPGPTDRHTTWETGLLLQR